jgi:hypothetical protein
MSLDAIRSEVLPNLLTAYLGPQGYRAEVFVHGDPSEVIYRSSPENARRIGPDADGSVRLFGIRYPEIARPLAGESRHIRGNSDSPDDDGRTPGEVLQTRAGHVIGDKSPVAVEGVIDNVLRSRRHILDSSDSRLRKLSSRIFPRSSRMRPH